MEKRDGAFFALLMVFFLLGLLKVGFTHEDKLYEVHLVFRIVPDTDNATSEFLSSLLLY